MTYGNYGRSCVRCGGTPDGESHRGYVGKCRCGLDTPRAAAPVRPTPPLLADAKEQRNG